MSKPVLAAGMVVYRQAATGVIEYLLLKASYPPYHWSPPKGHVDPGETEFKAALRETEEEAGFKVEDLEIKEDFEDVLNYPARGKPKRVTFWLARLKTNKEATLSKEHTDVTWADSKKAIELVGYPSTSALIKKCEEALTQKS